MRSKIILWIRQGTRTLCILFAASYMYSCEIELEIEPIPPIGPICWFCTVDTTVVYVGYGSISPAIMKVKTGTEVRFMNLDSVSHKLIAPNTPSFVLDTLKPGQLTLYQTGRAGTIDYQCTLHTHGATLVITP